MFDDFTKVYKQQKAHPARGINKYLMGITAHNIAVIHVVLNQEDEAIVMFQQALVAKRMAFGERHPEVAVRFC